MVAYTPRGGEFLVNLQTDGHQIESDIAVLDDGSFVIVWSDQEGVVGDTDGASIRAQRYAATGAPIGNEYQLNAQTIGNQVRPAVAAINGGGFVVTWTDASGVSDGSFSGIVAQMFDAAGSYVGNQFLVNTQTFSTQSSPAIARLTNGGFVITWSDTVGSSIKAQVYAAGGATVGGELTVNTQATGTQDHARVAGLSNGRFVIVWDDDSGTLGDGSGIGLKAQMYDAGGTTIGGEFLVNTTLAGDQTSPDIAALPGGGFVVSWTDSEAGGSIRAKLFDGAGARVGDEFMVNIPTGAQFGQSGSSVSALANGGFVIAWSVGVSVLDTDSRAQAFDATGAKVGAEFPVNTPTANFQTVSASAGLQNGGFAIVWTDGSTTLGDPSGLNVKAQLYQDSLPSNDFNGDFKSDILWREAGGQFAEWQMNGAQVVSNTGVAVPGNDWRFQDTGDFGGDGKSDVLLRHTSGQVVLWQMSGDHIDSNTAIQTVSNDYHIQGVADFDGDGKSDVLFRHDSGQVVLWQMNGDTIIKNTAVATPSRSYHIEGVGDFNGDGKNDVLIRHDSGQVILWQMNGDKVTLNTPVGEVSQQYHVQGIGDFNGDSKSDILWRHDSGQVVLWQMDGDKVTSNTAIAVVSNDYKIQDVRDYDDDGMSDVLFRHDSGQVVLWQMNGDQVVSNTAIQTVPNNWVIQAHHFDLL